jgi:diadenosine tetraphosphate (Ap4A) HIT family hydrolase
MMVESVTVVNFKRFEMLMLNKSLFVSLASEKDFTLFLETLNHFNVPYCLSDTPAPSIPLSSYPSPDQPESVRPYWTGKQKSLHWNFDRFMPPHLSIHADSPELLFNEAQDLGIAALQQLGFVQYTLVYRPHQNEMTLIPATEGAGGSDISDKLYRTSFVLWKQKGELPYAGLNSHAFQDRRGDLLRFSRTATWGNKSQLFKKVTGMLSAWLEHYQISSETLLSDAVSDIPLSDPLTAHERTVTKCNFCTPKIIQQQLVMEAGPWLILLNYRPAPGTKAQFLILPKAHTEDWSGLQENEKRSLHKIIVAISRSMEMNAGIEPSDVVTYVQNGNQTGQTAPHSHMHVLNVPAYAPYLIDIYYHLFHATSTPLSPAEMRAISGLFGPIIYQELLLERGPIQAPSV